jgi:hypothetical protein
MFIMNVRVPRNATSAQILAAAKAQATGQPNPFVRRLNGQRTRRRRAFLENLRAEREIIGIEGGQL